MSDNLSIEEDTNVNKKNGHIQNIKAEIFEEKEELNKIYEDNKIEDFDKIEEFKENNFEEKELIEKKIINNNDVFEEQKEKNMEIETNDNINNNIEEKKENEVNSSDNENNIEEKENKIISDEEDEKEEDENNSLDENDNKNLNSVNIKTNKMNKIEQEIEEIYDRIARIKEKLIDSKKGPYCNHVKLSEREVFKVIDRAYPIIEKEESMIEIEPPLYICGDIHGQFYDLLRVFDIFKFPPESKFLFLGDYVDRGKKSLECILLLLCLKIKYPSKIFLLRGNHESADVNRTYGFYDECKRKISVKIYKKFCNLFNILPLTALVGEKILCMHGGLAYDLKEINQLKEIKRPTEIPDAGLLCDLVWSDPDDCLIFDFSTNKERGISVCFSKQVVEEFTKKNDLDLICRAHQVVEEGFQFFSNMKLITVFTAPNYMGEFDNKGGILEVNENLTCSLHVLNPIGSNVDKKWRKISRFIN